MRVFVANARSATSLSVIRSLGRKKNEIFAATESREDCAIYSRYCTKKIFLKSDGNDADARVNELLKIIIENKIDVFLPVLSERILRKLSERKSEFEKYTRLPVPELEQFDTFDDKSKTALLLKSLNIPSPETYLVNDEQNVQELKETLQYPVLIKPHRGEGSAGIKIIQKADQLLGSFQAIKEEFGPCFIQEFVPGTKYAAVFLANKNSEPVRFFVHKAIREYPITGGPTCFLESVENNAMLEYGSRILKEINYVGLVNMEFILDEKEGIPRIIDINPRFYGPLQGAVNAGVDFPYELFQLSLNRKIEPDLNYPLGKKCRALLFEDTKHLISVLRGVKSPKYNIGKFRTLINYLNFFKDNGYFILSFKDPLPGIVKILKSIF